MTEEPKKPAPNPTPEVSDPHPGSVSDGTRKDAGMTEGTNAGGRTEKPGRAPPSA